MDESAEQRAFLAAVTEHPDDLRPRLVYADWLREQSDPALQDRGEFIHLQHALTHDGIPPGDVRTRSLARQRELMERYRTAWDKPFRGLVASTEYHNGFVERVTLASGQFVDHFAELTTIVPIIRVRLTVLGELAAMAANAGLALLRELDLRSLPVRGWQLSAVTHSSHATRLRALNLRHTEVGDAGVRSLVHSRAFPQLQYLNLSRAGLSVDSVRYLVSAIRDGRAPHLQTLVLEGAPKVPHADSYPLPFTLPLRLRQSLESQLGIPVPPRVSLLDSLRYSRGTLSPDLRQWVDRLTNEGTSRIRGALAQLALPEAVSRALVAACRRRVEWRASRLKVPAPDLSNVGNDPSELFRVLLKMSDPEKESAALADLLLDLYLRHDAGTLGPDGKTRAA